MSDKAAAWFVRTLRLVKLLDSDEAHMIDRIWYVDKGST